MVLNVLNSNAPFAELNRTNIALVPKIKNPSRMTEFRPISLSNVAYKLISKVLATASKWFSLILYQKIKVPSWQSASLQTIY